LLEEELDLVEARRKIIDFIKKEVTGSGQTVWSWG